MSKTQATVIPTGEPSRFKVAEYSFDELTGRVVGARPKPQEKEEGGFRLLVYGGKAEDPFERARRQAAELNAQAQAGLEEAQSQTEAIKKEASDRGYREGHEQGLADGLAAARARVEALCDNLGRVMVELDQVKAGVLAHMESEILAVVQATVDRVLLAAQPFEPSLIKRVVAEALGRLTDAEQVVVHLSPDDLAAVEEFKPELLKRIDGLAQLRLKADPQVHPGGVQVETPTEVVDATLAMRRERIIKLLSDTLHQSQNGDLSQVLEEAADETAPDLTPATPPEPEKS